MFDRTMTKTKKINKNFRENNDDKDNYEEIVEVEEEKEEEKTTTKKRNKNKNKSQKSGRGNNVTNKKSNQGNYNEQNNNLRNNKNDPNNFGHSSSNPNNYLNNYNNDPNNSNNNSNNIFEKSKNQNSYNDYPNQYYANSNYNLNDPNPNSIVYGDQYQRGIVYKDNIMRDNQNLRSLENSGAQPNIIQNFKNNLYQKNIASQKQDENNNDLLKLQTQSGNKISISFRNRETDNNNYSNNNRTQEQQFTTDKDIRTDSSPHGALNVDEERKIINNKKEEKDILSNTLLTETVLLPNQSDSQTLIQKQNIEQTELFTTSGQLVPFIQYLPERENPKDPNQNPGICHNTRPIESSNPLYPKYDQDIFYPNSQNPNLQAQEFPRLQKS
jgi:hypothetical protein